MPKLKGLLLAWLASLVGIYGYLLHGLKPEAPYFLGRSDFTSTEKPLDLEASLFQESICVPG